MLTAELRVLDGKHQGKSIPLNVKKFLVGRETDCQLRPNSDLVSRHHCVFTVDDYSVRLRDLGSTNGTYVNNERISGQVVLQPGDVVSIGKLTFEFVVRAPDAVEEEELPTGIVSEQDTMLPVESPLAEPEPVAQTPGDTTTLQTVGDIEAYQQQIAAFNQAAMAAAAAGQMMPAGMSSGMYPGFMPQMPAYPGMMPGMMPQMMPGQIMPGQMMPGYPGMMPGMMPQMMPMGYPAAMPVAVPQGQAAAVPPVAPPETASKAVNKIKEMPVTLPPPEETGVREAPPGGGGGAAKGTPSIANAAADVIKQHMQRRPR